MNALKDLVGMARLSIERALLGEVFPNLRAVVFTVSGPDLNIRFYIDGKISEEDEESVSCVETEVIADYDPEVSVVARCIRLDHPETIDDDGVWVFLRREHYIDDN